MSIEVRKIAKVVGHYVGLLAESAEARKVIESWGLKVGAELELTDKVMRQLEDFLAGGVEEI